MGEEIKIVTRQETFDDLAVRELAKGRSACICRIQFGRCTKSECNTCEVHKQYARCYNQMTDYNKRRLATYVSEFYVQDSKHPEHWMGHNGYKAYTFKWFLIIALILFVLFAGMSFMVGPFDQPNKDPVVSEEMDNRIITVMKYIQDYTYDLDKDGLVNCVDYAIMFKLTWDQFYPDLESYCKIVRNKSPSGMHHLFIHIWENTTDIEIEPWAKNPYKYLMTDNWDSQYNPKYNIYGETAKWLKEVK